MGGLGRGANEIVEPSLFKGLDGCLSGSSG